MENRKDYSGAILENCKNLGFSNERIIEYFYESYNNAMNLMATILENTTLTEGNNWTVRYFLIGDIEDLSKAKVYAYSEFIEKGGRFTKEEAERVAKFIEERPLPLFTKEEILEQWLIFKDKLEIEIYELYGK